MPKICTDLNKYRFRENDVLMLKYPSQRYPRLIKIVKILNNGYLVDNWTRTPKVCSGSTFKGLPLHHVHIRYKKASDLAQDLYG